MLDQVNFEIRKGEICGIISDNTDKLDILVNILGGLEKEDAGKILFKSRDIPVPGRSSLFGIARGNFILVNKLTVLDNIFLSGMHRFSRFGFINTKAMRKRAREILDTFQVQINLKIKLKYLNPNEKMIVEMARVLVQEPEYYIFDHVTRYLSLRQYDIFISILKDLKNRGKGIIVIPGASEDVKNLVDNLYYLKNSRMIEIENSGEISDEKLNELLLSSEKSHFIQVYDPIHRAKAIIEEKINISELDYQEIAHSVFMGYENFRRRFKTQVGLSPNQYFIKSKIEKAKEMLLYTNLEIKEIAEKLGFEDPYYFSRIFKEKVKVSPAKFRGVRLDTFLE
jgi:ABC-type sugar transport system ATPase subunit